jgi:hypothetical protein
MGRILIVAAGWGFKAEKAGERGATRFATMQRSHDIRKLHCNCGFPSLAGRVQHLYHRDRA